MAKVQVMLDGVLTEMEAPDVTPEQREVIRSARSDRLRLRIRLSATAFLARFTDEEYANIIGAANAQLEQGNAQLHRWIETVRAEGVVRVYAEQAQLAKSALIGAGLLTVQRANTIFAE